MTRFYLLRHGQTEWNHAGNRYCGVSNIQLDETGRLQAKKVATVLKEISFSAVYCSPLLRAMETATIIANEHHLPIHSDDRLSEINFGEWEGKTRNEIQSQYPNEWSNWSNNPDNTNVKAGITGESAAEVYQRAYDFFIEKSQLHQEQTILVVAHNTLNRILLTGSVQAPWKNYRKFTQSNTGVTILDVIDQEISWIQVNDTVHLK
jgi:uncharacterized phosphatase